MIKNKIKILIIIIISSILMNGCNLYKPHQDIFIPTGDNEEVGIYAYLNGSTITSCDVADTYYPVNGIFINDPIKGFYIDSSIPAIVYNSTIPRYILISTIATLSADLNGVTITEQIVKNNITSDCGPSQFLKYSDEKNIMIGREMLYLEKGDYITIEIKCDRQTDITFDCITTSAEKFYN